MNTNTNKTNLRHAKERRALEALVALALQNDSSLVPDSDIARYISKVPVKLTKEDKAALRRARPQFFKAIQK